MTIAAGMIADEVRGTAQDLRTPSLVTWQRVEGKIAADRKGGETVAVIVTISNAAGWTIVVVETTTDVALRAGTSAIETMAGEKATTATVVTTTGVMTTEITAGAKGKDMTTAARVRADTATGMATGMGTGVMPLSASHPL
jgi:hypothetical protein